MSSPPRWLAEMANEITANLHATDLLSPLGCHYHHDLDADQWEVSLFASTTHVIGGSLDGLKKRSGFFVDLRCVVQSFSEVRSCNWQSGPMGDRDEVGAHVAIDGDYDGRKIWLRILSSPPESIEHGREARVYKSQFEEVW